MLVMTRKQYGNVTRFERNISDSRLTEPSDGKVYDYRRMAKKVEQLGRPLTQNEAEKYRIK